MSHDVQLSPTTSNAPTAAPAILGFDRARHWSAGLPSPMAALRRQDMHVILPHFQKSGLSGHSHGPATDFRPRPAQGTDPHGHARFSALLPAALGSIRRDSVPPVSGGPGAQPGDASAPHAAGAPRYLKQPGRGLPAKLLTAIDRRCTSDVLGIYLPWTCAATGAGERRDLTRTTHIMPLRDRVGPRARSPLDECRTVIERVVTQSGHAHIRPDSQPVGRPVYLVAGGRAARGLGLRCGCAVVAVRWGGRAAVLAAGRGGGGRRNPDATLLSL